MIVVTIIFFFVIIWQHFLEIVQDDAEDIYLRIGQKVGGPLNDLPLSSATANHQQDAIHMLCQQKRIRDRNYRRRIDNDIIEVESQLLENIGHRALVKEIAGHALQSAGRDNCQVGDNGLARNQLQGRLSGKNITDSLALANSKI